MFPGFVRLDSMAFRVTTAVVGALAFAAAGNGLAQESDDVSCPVPLCG
jgi:hypothetical protein